MSEFPLGALGNYHKIVAQNSTKVSSSSNPKRSGAYSGSGRKSRCGQRCTPSGGVVGRVCFLASFSSERPLHPLARGPLFHLQSQEAMTSASAVTSPSLTLSPSASLMRTPVMTLGFPWVTQHLRREADLQGGWSHGWRVPMT